MQEKDDEDTDFCYDSQKFNPPNNPIYIPLQVGAALNLDLGYMRDDVGDSISALNPYYGELTGMYWLWKTIMMQI